MTKQEYKEKIFEIYELAGVLSRNNGSEVLKIRHREKGSDLILRLLPDKAKPYSALHSIKFLNLPEIYDVISLDDGTAVLEEYIEGITVAQVMECGRYRLSGAKKVLSAVCDALTVLHGKGIVHRDVKPENVIVSPSGRVVLVDFNASRIMKASGKDTVVLGTVGYASPEQMGVSKSDNRTDIYAAGVMLNVMLTGKHPSEKMAKGRAGKIVRKCTFVSPEERFQSAEKLKKAL